MQESKEEKNTSHIKVCRTNGKQVLIKKNKQGDLIRFTENYKHEDYIPSEGFNNLCKNRAKINSVILQSLHFIGITEKLQNYKSISGFKPI